MKIRNGFVSNSSSSSFLIYGTKFDESEVKEFFLNSNETIRIRAKHLLEYGGDDDVYSFLDTICSKILKSSLELQYVEEIDSYYIGKSWDKIGDDETGFEFKETVKSELIKAFGDSIEIATHSYAWYNG